MNTAPTPTTELMSDHQFDIHGHQSSERVTVHFARVARDQVSCRLVCDCGHEVTKIATTPDQLDAIAWEADFADDDGIGQYDARAHLVR